VFSAGCLKEQPPEEVVVPSGPKDGRLLRCMHEDNELERDSCLMMLAAADKNSDYCESITGERMKLVCRSVLSEDIIECNQAFDGGEDATTYCNALSNKRENDCLNIADYGLAGECVYLLSFVKYDRLVCGILPDRARRSKCLMEFALNYGSPVLCDVLTEDFFKRMCFMEYALTDVNEGFCEKITDNASKTLCRERVRVRALEPADCLEFEEDGKLAWCVDAVAKDILDDSVCALHADFKKRLTCEKMVRRLV